MKNAKIIIIFGLLFLLMTGCGNSITKEEYIDSIDTVSMESELKQETEASVSIVESVLEESEETDIDENEDEAAASETVEKEERSEAEMPFELMQLELDTDSDGEAEMIYFAVNEDKCEYILSVKKSTGDTIFCEMNDYFFTAEDVKLKSWDTTEGGKLFYIEIHTGSDYGELTVYGFADGEVKNLGSFVSIISEGNLPYGFKDDVLSLVQRVELIQSDFCSERFSYDAGTGIFTEIREEHALETQYWTEPKTELIKEMMVYCKPDSASDTVALLPGKVKFIKLDENHRWVYVEGEDGIGGWISGDGGWKQWREYFTDLAVFG